MFPQVLHPVRIRLVQIDPVNSPAKHPQVAELAGPPVFKAPIDITCQHQPGATKAYSPSPGGDRPRSDGSVTINAQQLAFEAPGVEPQVGDRIVGIYLRSPREKTDIDWHLIEIKPIGQYIDGPGGWQCLYKKFAAQSEFTGADG